MVEVSEKVAFREAQIDLSPAERKRANQKRWKVKQLIKRRDRGDALTKGQLKSVAQYEQKAMDVVERKKANVDRYLKKVGRDCVNERAKLNQDKYRKEQPKKYLYSLAKRRAAKKGQEFTICLSDLPEIPKVCPLLGVPITGWSGGVGDKPSIDRIDSSKGYVPGNVWFISHRANRIKSDASADELALMAKNLKKAGG